MRVEAGGRGARPILRIAPARRHLPGPVGSKNYAVPVSYRFPLSPRVFAIWMWID